MTDSGDSGDSLGRDGGDGDPRGHDSSGTDGDREGREMPSGRTEPEKGERRDGERRDGERRDSAWRCGSGGSDDGRRFMSDVAAADRASDAPAPEASVSDAPATDGAAGSSVDSLLAAAVRGGTSAHTAGEARAVAAFRAARETGARTARTRRRDDWRPNARRRVQFSIRTTLAVLLASLTLGGVAFAAIGSATHDDEGVGGDREGHGGQDRRPRTTDGAPARPGPSPAPRTNSATADGPDRDEDPPASQQPDKADRRADGKGNGGSNNGSNNGSNIGNGKHDDQPGSGSGSDRDDSGTGDRQREAPRPSEPNASRQSESPSESPSESTAPNEPGGPGAPGVRPKQAGEAQETRAGTRVP